MEKEFLEHGAWLVRKVRSLVIGESLLMPVIFSRVISETYLTIFVAAVAKVVELFTGTKMLKFLHKHLTASDIGVR